MKSCIAPVQYSKGDNPHRVYKDSFSLHPQKELGGGNIWVGHYKSYTITVTQEHHQSDITEQDIRVECNPSDSSDTSISVYFPRGEIAKALNDFLNKTFA